MVLANSLIKYILITIVGFVSGILQGSLGSVGVIDNSSIIIVKYSRGL